MLRREIVTEQLTAFDKELTPVGFALIKPDGFKRLVMSEFEDNLCDQGLSIVLAFPVLLDRESIIGIFPHLLLPSDFGDEWKNDVIEALQEGPSIAYVITGENPVENVLNIKRDLRNKYTDRTDYTQRIVKNLFHSSDTVDESRNSISIALGQVDYNAGIDIYVKYSVESSLRVDNHSVDNIYTHSKRVANLATDILYSEELDNEVEENLIFAASMLHHIGEVSRKNDQDLKQTEQIIYGLSWLPESVKRESFKIIFDSSKQPVITTGGKVLYDAHLIEGVRSSRDFEEKVEQLHYPYSQRVVTKFLKN